jgi:hypothetical protein
VRAALYVTKNSKRLRQVDAVFDKGSFASSAHSFVYHFAKHGSQYGKPGRYLSSAAAKLRSVSGQRSRSVRGSPGGLLNGARNRWYSFW